MLDCPPPGQLLRPQLICCHHVHLHDQLTRGRCRRIGTIPAVGSMSTQATRRAYDHLRLAVAERGGCAIS